MALKIIDSQRYVRLDLEGHYWVYVDSQSRKNEKKATSPSIVNQKYYELIRNIYADTERWYYDPNSAQLAMNLEAEHKKYLQNLSDGITTGKYPLMKQHIKDVEKSIPNIVNSGQLGVVGTTLEEVYNFVKKVKFFGDVEDC